MQLNGVVYAIEPDQQDSARAVVRVTLDGTVTRPSIAMTMAEAGEFKIGQRVALTLTPAETS